MPLPGVISLHVTDAARMTGRSRQRIYEAIKNGKLKAYKPDFGQNRYGDMLIMVEDLEAWLRANPVDYGNSDVA